MRRMRQTVALGVLSGGLAGAGSALLLFWPDGLMTGLPTGLFLAALAAALPLILMRRQSRRPRSGILSQSQGRR